MLEWRSSLIGWGKLHKKWLVVLLISEELAFGCMNGKHMRVSWLQWQTLCEFSLEPIRNGVRTAEPVALLNHISCLSFLYHAVFILSFKPSDSQWNLYWLYHFRLVLDQYCEQKKYGYLQVKGFCHSPVDICACGKFEHVREWAHMRGSVRKNQRQIDKKQVNYWYDQLTT